MDDQDLGGRRILVKSYFEEGDRELVRVVHSSVYMEADNAIAVIVGQFQRQAQAEMQAAAQRAGAQCIFASDVGRTLGLLRSLETTPRCLFVSVKADLAALAEAMRDAVEYYTIPIVALVAYPNGESYQLANRQGADDCIPEYETGGMTRRLANLVQGGPPRLPRVEAGCALVAISDENHRKRIGRRLRSAGYDVQFVSSDGGTMTLHEGQTKPSVLVTTPGLAPEAEFAVLRANGVESEPFRIPRVNVSLSTDDLVAPRDLSEPEVTERLMFLVDEATRPVMNDGRATRRIQHSSIATFRSRRTFEHNYALTDNISRQGLYLRTLDPPPVGTDVRVSLRDKYTDILQLRGTVAWRFAPSQVGGRTCPGFGISIAEAACPPDDLEKYRSLYADVLHEVERIEQLAGAPRRGGGPDPQSGVLRALSVKDDTIKVG